MDRLKLYYVFWGVHIAIFCAVFLAYANPLAGPPQAGRSGLSASELKCEYRINPLGIDETQPQLSWILESDERGQRQTAYRILTAASMEKLEKDEGDIWDTGRVESAQSINIACNGKLLKSGTRYWWKVRVWDKDGRESAWSQAAWWEMGLLLPEDWAGSWIGDGKADPEKPEDFYRDDPAPLFRKEFNIERELRRARLYISGLGYYEAYLNGKRVGDHVLDPGWTSYGKRIFYSVYDVTELLARDGNTVGVTLGNGWYNPLPLILFNKFNLREFMTIGRPKFIAQLNIDYADGTLQAVVSDQTWKTAEGPILRNNVYLGEVYDARREQPGWNTNDFNDAGWKPAAITAAPPGKLREQHQPPIRITKIIKPAALTEPLPGVHIFDMGQNFAGVARLRVKGPAGTEVRLRYGELLFPDGTLNFRSTVACHIVKQGDHKPGGPGAPDTAWQADTYILKGEGEEVFASRFGFNGFRYVEVTGYPGAPLLESIEGLRMNADLPPAGDIACSNPLFNLINEMVRWTFMSNVFSIQSDCPGREKFQYGGDIYTSCEAFIYNYDMANFYIKTIRDYEDAARPNGGMTECAPYNGIADGGLGGGTGPIEFTLAHPYLQLMLYRFYGDKRIIREQYESTKRLIEYIKSQAPEHIVIPGLGDHMTLEPKSIPVTSTAFYYHHVRLLSELAGILGEKEDSRKYGDLAEEIKKAFIRNFIKPGTGRIDTNTQSCQVFALYYDLLPPEETGMAFDVLLDEILVKHKGHVSTGIFGTKMMFDILRYHDRGDVAYTIANQKTFPGWGNMLENGSTTLWETWQGRERASFNHPMFGSVSEWLYRVIAGINPHPEAVGFDRIEIKPYFGNDLTWAKGNYYSVRGEISSSWRRENGLLHVEISIPPNTTADVYLPAKVPEDISEAGIPIKDSEGIEFLRMENNAAVLNVAAGNYAFTVK